MFTSSIALVIRTDNSYKHIFTTQKLQLPFFHLSFTNLHLSLIDQASFFI